MGREGKKVENHWSRGYGVGEKSLGLLWGTRVGIQGQRIVWGSRMSMECLI